VVAVAVMITIMAIATDIVMVTHMVAVVAVATAEMIRRNNETAEDNRIFFERKNATVVHLMGSAGAGKTAFMERWIADNNKDVDFFVVAGDQQSMNDANRIQHAGASVVQINTGTENHLDANMVRQGIDLLHMPDNSMVVIENLGNMTTPSHMDLGETMRVVVLATTDGEDKAQKYPFLFQTADVCIINKTDLLPHLNFSVDEAKNNVLKVNKGIKFFEVSAQSGDGMDKWYEYAKQTHMAYTME